MEHNAEICKRTQCETVENHRVLTSVYGPLSSEDLGVAFFAFMGSVSINYLIAIYVA